MNEFYHVPGCRVERLDRTADMTTLVARGRRGRALPRVRDAQ